jgi:hypothetical protein
MRHYLTDPATGRRIYAPSPEDDYTPVCPACGNVEVEVEGFICTACLELKAEKEAETVPYNPIAAAMQLDPRVARIIQGAGIPPASDPVPVVSPRGGDFSEARAALRRAVATLERITKETK